MNRKYELDKTLIDAYHFHRSDMFQEALESYMSAAEVDPENDEIWFEMGSCLYSLGNYRKSLECGITSLKLDSTREKTWFNCGLALSMMNENDRALSFYTEAIKLNPSYTMAYYARANTYYYKSEWTRAIEDYTIALASLDPFTTEEEESHFYRALCYEKIGSLDFARIDYNWVLAKSPRRYDTIRRRAMLSFKEKKYQAALTDISKARELYPESVRLSRIQRKIETQIEKTAGENKSSAVFVQ